MTVEYYRDMTHKELSVLLGLTVIGLAYQDDEITLHTECGREFHLLQVDPYCNLISIESISGDPESLLGSPILRAEETTSNEDPKDEGDASFTWTFYELATIKGSLTIKWIIL
jgi:hypothetical protein